MANFEYKALKNDGTEFGGQAEASDKFSLSRDLKKNGYTLLYAKNLDGKINFLERLNGLFAKVKIHEKIIFAKNLSAMIKAGLSISRAMDIIDKQTANAKFKKVIEGLSQEIKKGGNLSQAMAKFSDVFPPVFVSMVKAGEESGTIAESLKTVADQLDKSYALEKKVKGALIYPAIVVSAMLIVGVLMLIFVVPTLTSTFKELKVPLPASTKAIVVVSDFLAEKTLLSLLIIITFISAAVFGSKTKRGKRFIDSAVLRLPVIGELVRKTNSSRTTRTLSSLLGSGVSIIEAINITEDVVENHHYKEILSKAKTRVEKGEPLSKSFIEAEKFYPILVGEMMAVGEETGRLSEMLLEIASFYEEEVESATKNMATIVEPVLMVIVGVVVGFFAISMISPTYSLLNNV
ncbi:MAG: type II secretion system F family protein [Patescibacteria group bacterium]